jgi:hypothetical protein
MNLPMDMVAHSIRHAQAMAGFSHYDNNKKL